MPLNLAYIPTYPLPQKHNLEEKGKNMYSLLNHNNHSILRNSEGTRWLPYQV